MEVGRFDIEIAAHGNGGWNLGVKYERVFHELGKADPETQATGQEVEALYREAGLNLDKDQLVPVEQARDYRQDVERNRKASLFRQAFVQRQGHCNFMTGELIASLEALPQRVDTGRWNALDRAGAVNAAASPASSVWVIQHSSASKRRGCRGADGRRFEGRRGQAQPGDRYERRSCQVSVSAISLRLDSGLSMPPRMQPLPAPAGLISRRAVLQMMVASGVASVLAACTAPAPSTPATPGPAASAPSGSATAAPSSKPRSGGILRQGNLGDLPTLDGNFLNGQSTIYPVWDRLVELDPQLNPIGILAESWDVDDKYTRIALHLHKGVQFHTGRELTADDVLWNIKRVSTDPKVAGGGFFNWMSHTLTGLETADKYTLVLHAERSWPAVFDVLSLLSIIDPATFEASGPTRPTGTGPFRFAEYAQGDHFTLKKNPNYWQTGKPYLDGIEIKIFNDPQSMVAQLEGGAIDLVLGPPIRDVARLSKDQRYGVTFHDYSGGANLVFVQAKDGAGPTTNKQFRQALNYAIDRKRWADAILPAYGTSKTLPLARPNPGYDPARDQALTFDLDKARSLVEASGVGTPNLEVIWNATITDYATAMQIYQQDLAKIGITVTLKPTEPVTFVDQTYNSKFPNLAAGATLYGNLRPGFFAGNVYYSPYNNWSSFHSDQLIQLTDGLLHETDPVKQKQIYADWLNYIQDESWAMPWSNTAPRFVYSSKVHGVRWNLADYMLTNDAWLEG